MSTPSTSALLRRVAEEHRRTLLPLAIVLVVNVLIYGLAVYPMARRVANIEQSSNEARIELAAARQEFNQANGTLTGKDKAAQELSAFYATVLPRGLAGARRLTTLKLLQLADGADLDRGPLSARDVVLPDSTLKQLKMTMAVSGSYPNLRGFIHQLEVSPDFVVIDNLSLSEGADDGATLVVNLEMSTYYRDTP
jgi:hypothetical protein